MRRSRRFICTGALIGLVGVAGFYGLPWSFTAAQRPEASVGAQLPRVSPRSPVGQADRNGSAGRLVGSESAQQAHDPALMRRDRSRGRLSIPRVTETRAPAQAWAAEAPPHPDPELDSEWQPASMSDERVVLDALSLPQGAISLRATGVDYGAPRRLTLWRVDADRAARLAETRSQPGGHFDFGQVLVPMSGIRLIATADEHVPDEGQRADAQLLHGALPPPEARAELDHDDAWSLVIEPALPGGELLLADAWEQVYDTLKLPDNGGGAARIALDLDSYQAWERILVAQHLPDGRRSGWRRVSLPDVAAARHARDHVQ